MHFAAGKGIQRFLPSGLTDYPCAGNLALPNFAGMEDKDYYHILRIRPTATISEIKKAYRKLALRYHPDKNPGDPITEAVFREINEAYDILSDVRRREHYHWQNPQYATRNVAKFQTGELLSTPEAILQEAIQLNKMVAGMDPFRINRDALYFRLEQILSPYHLDLLVLENNRDTCRKIIQAIITGAKPLSYSLVNAICEKLKVLAGNDPECREAIVAFDKKQKRTAIWERSKIWIALLLTIILCLLIFFMTKQV